MNVRHTTTSLLAMLTLVAVTSAGEQPSLPKPVVGPEWKPVEESIVLPTGIKAHATYHFNRNALKTACLTEDGVLAVTDSGNLLRFDLKDFRLQQEIRPDAAITLLAKAEGIGVVAARVDGRVFRIDPKTLKQTEFANLKAAPRWMTGYHDASKLKSGILAVLSSENERGDRELELHRIGFEQPNTEKYKMPSDLIPNRGVSAFLLDRKARLWLGQDRGEWGGWCGSLDLNALKGGQIEALKDSLLYGVYGFVELPDGQVWAYGGMLHLGLSSGFIARVDRGKFESLGSFSSFGLDRPGKPAAPPKLPRYPITHVMPDPKGDGLLVFAYCDLFRVDAKLTNWRLLGSIELRYHSGRPDAMGSYPALRTILAAGDKSGDLICTTARDGLLRIREGQATHHVVPGQIGDDWINKVVPAFGTTLLRGKDLWRYTGGNWQPVSLFPPVPPGEREGWYDNSLPLDLDRRPVALCRSNTSPGAWALTRLKDGKVEILASGRDVSFSARAGFATPDGGFWCLDHGKLLRLVDGTWQPVGKAPESYPWDLRVVGQDKPPWILHCEDGLYRLTPGKGADDAELTPIPLPLPGELSKVRDALAIESGQVLLVCGGGLLLFDEKSGQLSRCPFAPPKGEVRAICKDGRGRTWLAGSSVWMVDLKGTVHEFDKLVRYGAVANAIGADSTDATGVIVALGTRGVLFIRAEDADR